MSELRGIPKRSRAALVVALVVLFQVLALAVVGLRAITGDRQATREDQVRKQADEARRTLESAQVLSRRAIRTQLQEAFRTRTWQDFESLRSREQAFVAHAFHVRQEDSAFVWFDREPTYVTWLPRAQALARAATAKARGDSVQERLDQIGRSGVPRTERRRMVWAFLEEHPLHLGPTRGPHAPKSVPLARQALALLVPAPGDADATAPTRAALRHATLKALEIHALNRLLEGHAWDAFDRDLFLDPLRPAVRTTLAEFPEALSADVRREAKAFMARADLLAEADARRPMEGALELAAVALADRKDAIHLVDLGDGGLHAIQATPDGQRFVLLTLDGAALRDLVLGLVDRERLGELGVALHLEGVGEAPEGERLREVEMAPEGVDLPLRARLIRVREPSLEVEGRSEIFYWAIIGVAALGLLGGAVLLWRLTTREIRLARLKADFVGNLSHELKTPLTSIGLFTEMLVDGKLESDADKQEAYEVLAQEAERLQRIVKRMIDVARKEARGVDYDMGAGDLNTPVHAAVARFRRIVTEPGLDLRVDLATEPLPLRMDASALDDVITNLLSNAWKYRRGDAATIAVRTARRGGWAEVAVTDNGIGIPRAERKRVFEMFYRAEQYLTQPVQGTGLGLALVRTIVRGHQGRVHLTAGEGGVGSTFRLRFPLDRRARRQGALPAEAVGMAGHDAPEADGPAPSAEETT